MKIASIHEFLDIVKEGDAYVICCRECGQIICRADENYKSRVPKRDRNPADIGHNLVRSDWIIYREYYCPNCATLLDVEPMREADGDLWDIQMKIP